MEKFTKPQRIITAFGLALGLSALSACGQTDPPSRSEIEDNISYFILTGVTAADGGPVRCAVYGSETTFTEDSKSWFGFACDFEGTATFPSEK